MGVKRKLFFIETRLTPQPNPRERTSVVAPNEMSDIAALIKIEPLSPTAIVSFVEPKPEPVSDKCKMPPPNTFHRLETIQDRICQNCGKKFKSKFERYVHDAMSHGDQCDFCDSRYETFVEYHRHLKLCPKPTFRIFGYSPENFLRLRRIEFKNI